jgi:hypothetical protein
LLNVIALSGVQRWFGGLVRVRPLRAFYCNGSNNLGCRRLPSLRWPTVSLLVASRRNSYDGRARSAREALYGTAAPGRVRSRRHFALEMPDRETLEHWIGQL